MMTNSHRFFVVLSATFAALLFLICVRLLYEKGSNPTPDVQRIQAHGWVPPRNDPYRHNAEQQTTVETGSVLEDEEISDIFEIGQVTEDNGGFVKDWFTFQATLDLPLPKSNLTHFAKLAPRRYVPGELTNAFATLIVTEPGMTEDPTKDPYFEAALFLAWRFLWSSQTRSHEYPFIAFVAPHITQEQRTLLAGMGAVVRELDLVPWQPQNGKGVHERWALMFSKLHLWKQTDFQRIALYDADAFPFQNIDGLFNVVKQRDCVTERMVKEDKDYAENGACKYTMAGVQDFDSGAVNGGLLVMEPNLQMHAKLLAHYNETDKYDNSLVEQAYLGWQFEQDGPFPAQFIDRTWNGYFPKDNEEGKLKVIHQKLWADFITADWMKSYWYDGWNEMIDFINSDQFRMARQKDEEVYRKALKIS